MTNTASKEFWLETAILDMISTFSQHKHDALSWVKDSQNRSKVIGISFLLGGGGYGLFKLYKYLTKKPRNQQQPDAEKAAAKKPRTGITSEFFGKLWDLIKIAVPEWRSKETYYALFLVLVIISKSLLSNYINSIGGDLMRDMVMQNKGDFFKLLAYFTFMNLGLSFMSPFITYLVVRYT